MDIYFLKKLFSPEEFKKHTQKRLIKKIAATEKKEAIGIIKGIMEKTDDEEIKAFAAKHLDSLNKLYHLTHYKEQAEKEKLAEDKELLKKEIKKRDKKIEEISKKMGELFPEAAKDEDVLKDAAEILKKEGAAQKPLLPNAVFRLRSTFTIILAGILILAIFSIRESRTAIKGVGKIIPLKIAVLQTEISGKIAELYADEGDMVNKGDLICTLEKHELYTYLAQQELNSEIARQELIQTELSLTRLRDEYKRFQALFEVRAITQKQRDDAEYSCKYAETKRDEFKANLEETAKEIELIKNELAKTDITTPISGRVLTPKMQQKTGLYLEEGSHICTIADMDSLVVEVPIREKHIERVHIGQKASIRFKAYPQYRLRGKVVAIEELVFERETPTEIPDYQFYVLVELDETPMELKSGMTAIVSLR